MKIGCFTIFLCFVAFSVVSLLLHFCVEITDSHNFSSPS